MGMNPVKSMGMIRRNAKAHLSKHKHKHHTTKHHKTGKNHSK
jgi:hypothetical protein